MDYIEDNELREVYQEDTVGRKYHTPIVSKQGSVHVEKPSETATMNFNKPMKYKEFAKLSDSVKVLYLQYLVDHYNANAPVLCKMLGISRSFWQNHIINGLNLKGLCPRGQAGKMTTQDTEAWNEFIGVVPEEQVAPMVDIERPSTNVTKCSFGYEGALNFDDLKSKISAFVSEGTKIDIWITIDVIKEEE
jgi:hypothetical protein